MLCGRNAAGGGRIQSALLHDQQQQRPATRCTWQTHGHHHGGGAAVASPSPLHGMRLIQFTTLPQQDQEFLKTAKAIASRSVTLREHKVGCVLACADQTTFLGATAARTRAIGSTCAERMAVDQWYFARRPKPEPRTCYVVGTFDRASWRDMYTCTPCGNCLEMFLELFIAERLRRFWFVCGSWNLQRILLAELAELFPQYGKGGWPYKKNLGRR